jgi:hypothetical protein
MSPPAPPTTRATTSFATPGPSTRRGIAADCNRLATMARQRHPPHPAVTTTPGWNLRPPTERVIPDTSPEMEPLVDVVRALQSSMSAITTRLNNLDERPIAAGQQVNTSAIVTPPATLNPLVPVVTNVPDHDTALSYTLTCALLKYYMWHCSPKGN